VELADDIDERPREPDLLFRLAQRRCDRVVIVFVKPPAGETDLTGMAREIRRAFGEQNAQRFALDDWNQHRGRRQRAVGGDALAPFRIQIEIPALRQRVRQGAKLDALANPPPQFVIGHGSGEPKEKNTPSLQTPSSRPEAVARSSPMPTNS